MQPPRGYTLGKCLHASARCEVHAGVREDDEAPVAIKSFRATADDTRAAHEYEVLRSLQGRGLPRPLERIAAPAPTLVFERIPGIRLTTWVQQGALSPSDFLDVAIELAEIVARVHDARLLHRDIQPDNVLVDSETRATHLIGFGLAQPLGASHAADAHAGVASFSGVPQYIAPEQTGRMDRGMDTRSDLYSLGATLYFALTGQPPFVATDSLALFHAHMARLPEPPVALRPDLPATLSRIVVKLLQKEPEDRYQTASALQRDLVECRDQLRRTGHIDDDFPLGTADAPFRPLFSKKLYGRSAEIATLHEAYARAVQGQTQLVTISGPPGSGKSSLVHELRRALPETRGYLTTGKFDLYRRDIPYLGFSAAFESLFDQILAESEASVLRWRERLRGALGNLGGVLVEWIPELGAILGETPAPPRLGPRETQARLALAVHRLVEGCAHKDHPLVLVLEDLQWSDPGSRELLESLLRKPEGGALLVLAIYRDDEVDATHPFSALLGRLAQSSLPLVRIVLSPLATSACAEMLSETLARRPDEVLSLAECVVRKTGSNPLLVQQFVLHMHRLGLFQYVYPTGWRWDEAAIAAADIPEGAVGLMVAKLGGLAAETRALLEFASCVADEFSVEWLAELSERPRAALEAGLFALIQEGLLAPSPRGFRFVHDRIREGAQALMSDAQRATLHQRIGRLLLDRAPDESLGERVFETADHLNRAGSALAEEDRPRALAVNLAAGRRALASGAALTAGTYLHFGRALFRDSDWERDPELALALFLEAAEAAYQSRDYPLALQLLKTTDARPLAPERHMQISVARIRTLCQVDFDATLDETLAALRRLGMRLPRKVSQLRAQFEIVLTDWCLRGRLGPPSSAPAWRSDPPRSQATALVSAGLLALTWRSPELVCLLASRNLRHQLRRGLGTYAGLTLATHALHRVRFLRSVSLMARYAEAAESWLQGKQAPSIQLTLWAFMRPWFEPRQRVLDALWEVAETLVESGEVESRNVAIQEYFGYLAFSGEPLDVLARKLSEFRRQVGMREAPFLEFYLNAYQHLQRAERTEIDWDHELSFRTLEWRTSLVVVCRLHWSTVLCLLGEYRQAAVHSLAAEVHVLATGIASAYVADFWMFHGLTHAVLASESSGKRRRQARKTLQRCRRMLARWAAHVPDAVHMCQLLEAERARLSGRTAVSLRCYQSAAERARERGYRHHAAVAHERRAHTLRQARRFTEANLALGQAIELYREWNAHAKVRELEALQRRHGD